MKLNIIFKICFLLLIIFSCATTLVNAQDDHNKALAAADSSKFSPNKKGGWQLFNSFVSSYQKDSARLELIMQHANNIDWKQEQYVGKIKYEPLQPSKEQSLPFNLLTDNYVLRIDDNGKCYLKFMSGSLPTANPVILPLSVLYRL
jgi:hypothetical protein